MQVSIFTGFLYIALYPLFFVLCIKPFGDQLPHFLMAWDSVGEEIPAP
jgi:hypothetical protein